MAQPMVVMQGQEMDLQGAVDRIWERLTYLTEVRDAAFLRMQRENRPMHLDILNLVGVCEGLHHSDVEDFFMKFEDASEIAGWTGQQKLRLTRLLLKGPALFFFKSDQKCQEANTYASLKALLTERFSDKMTAEEYHRNLWSIKQEKGEETEAYADRVRWVSRKATPTSDNPLVREVLAEEADQRALAAFTRGLLGRTGFETRMSLPTSFPEAVKTAVAIDYLGLPSDVAKGDQHSAEETTTSDAFMYGSDHAGAHCNSLTPRWGSRRYSRRQRGRLARMRIAPAYHKRDTSDGEASEVETPEECQIKRARFCYRVDQNRKPRSDSWYKGLRDVHAPRIHSGSDRAQHDFASLTDDVKVWERNCEFPMQFEGVHWKMKRRRRSGRPT